MRFQKIHLCILLIVFVGCSSAPKRAESRHPASEVPLQIWLQEIVSASKVSETESIKLVTSMLNLSRTRFGITHQIAPNTLNEIYANVSPKVQLEMIDAVIVRPEFNEV